MPQRFVVAVSVVDAVSKRQCGNFSATGEPAEEGNICRIAVFPSEGRGVGKPNSKCGRGVRP
jgi:hypothetical protein